MAKQTRLTISVRPERERFGPEGQRKLQAYLRKQRADTKSTDVSAKSELLLTERGTVQPLRDREYRYTTPALSKVCQMACSSLFPVIDDVSGQSRKLEESTSAYSLQQAVDIFNAVIELRFATRFQGQVKLLWNRGTRRIEGAAGLRYSHLENHQLLELAQSAASAATTALDFHEAAVDGRRLLLRFVQPNPLFKVRVGDDSEPYFGGIHFVNSEIAGECSVRAAVLLVRGGHGTSALGSYVNEGSGGRVVHTGRDFQERVQTLMQNVLAQFEKLDAKRKSLQRLVRTPLGLTTTDDKNNRVRAVKRAVQRAGLKPGLAQRAVESMMYFGSNPPGRRKPVGYVGKKALSERTAYDLYNSLTREALLLPAEARESAEQAAFQILTNKVQLGRE